MWGAAKRRAFVAREAPGAWCNGERRSSVTPARLCTRAPHATDRIRVVRAPRPPRARGPAGHPARRRQLRAHHEDARAQVVLAVGRAERDRLVPSRNGARVCSRARQASAGGIAGCEAQQTAHRVANFRISARLAFGSLLQERLLPVRCFRIEFRLVRVVDA